MGLVAVGGWMGEGLACTPRQRTSSRERLKVESGDGWAADYARAVVGQGPPDSPSVGSASPAPPGQTCTGRVCTWPSSRAKTRAQTHLGQIPLQPAPDDAALLLELRDEFIAVQPLPAPQRGAGQLPQLASSQQLQAHSAQEYGGLRHAWGHAGWVSNPGASLAQGSWGSSSLLPVCIRYFLCAAALNGRGPPRLTHLVKDVRLQHIGQVEPRRQLLRKSGLACRQRSGKRASPTSWAAAYCPSPLHPGCPLPGLALLLR